MEMGAWYGMCAHTHMHTQAGPASGNLNTHRRATAYVWMQTASKTATQPRSWASTYWESSSSRSYLEPFKSYRTRWSRWHQSTSRHKVTSSLNRMCSGYKTELQSPWPFLPGKEKSLSPSPESRQAQHLWPLNCEAMLHDFQDWVIKDLVTSALSPGHLPLKPRAAMWSVWQPQGRHAVRRPHGGTTVSHPSGPQPLHHTSPGLTHLN